MAAAVFVCFHSYCHAKFQSRFQGPQDPTRRRGVCVCGVGRLGRLRGEFGVLIWGGGGIQFSRRLDFGGINFENAQKPQDYN